MSETKKAIPVHGPREKFVFPPNKDGIATYNYPNTYFSYTGEWKDGKKQGKGRLSIGKNGYYEGTFVDGEITGNGVRVFPNGSKYEGEFLNGEFNGKGKYENTQNGEVYEGEWKDNKRNGNGTLTFSDGTKYIGEFVNHKRTGHGVYTNKDGDHYDGEWIDNRIEGKGKMVYANGDEYEGDFVNGEKHGNGKIHWSESHLTFDGEWQNDKCLYNPTGLVISELPPFTPGVSLQNITVTVVGGEGESGRTIKIMIEFGRIDPNAQQKKQAKPKKNEVVNKEPGYMILNPPPEGDPTTDSYFILVNTEKGVATLPVINVPADAEQNTYTIIVSDESKPNPLPQIMADFTYVPAAQASAKEEKTSAKGKPTTKKPPVSKKSSSKKK